MTLQNETRRAGGAAGPLDLSCGEADSSNEAHNHPGTQARNPAAVAAMRRDLNLAFLHECVGGIAVHCKLVQTFAEIGDVPGTCYSLKRLFAHAKAAHPVFTELRDGLVSKEGTAR